LAPRLGKILLDRGETENTEIIVRSAKRSESDYDQHATLVAKTEEAKGQHEEARSIASAVISNGQAESWEAVQLLVQQHINDDTTVPAELALLAETFDFEMRNEPTHKAVFETYVLATAKSGQFEKAFFLMNDRWADFQDDRAPEITDIVFSDFVRRSEDGDFVKGYFNEFARFAGNLSEETRVEIATRLSDLGFPVEAYSVVSMQPGQTRSEAARLIRAKYFALTQDFDRALTELRDADSSEALVLRGDILLRKGENKIASETFLEAERDGDAAEAMWLSEDWSQLTSENSPVFGGFSEIAQQAPEQIDVEDGMLARTQSVIEASASAREELEKLLLDLTIPE
jgi:hypothetical protein